MRVQKGADQAAMQSRSESTRLTGLLCASLDRLAVLSCAGLSSLAALVCDGPDDLE